jgi:hypothetical protein
MSDDAFRVQRPEYPEDDLASEDRMLRMQQIRAHEEHAALRDYCLRVIRAAAILTGRDEERIAERLFRCNQWLPVLIKYNPRCPTDTLPITVAMSWELECHPFISVGDIDYIWDCLPEMSEPRLELRADCGWEITGVRSKHGSSRVVITVPNGLRLPCSVRAQLYADMDEDENHSDSCPRNLYEDGEDDPDCEYECNCSADIVCERRLVFDDPCEEPEAAQARIRELLNGVIWGN